jgi:hypothetical protein
MLRSDELRLDRSVVRIYRKGEEPEEEPVANGLAHIWSLTLACWALGNPELAKAGAPRMRRDIVVLKRRAPKKA